MYVVGVCVSLFFVWDIVVMGMFIFICVLFMVCVVECCVS